MTPLSPADAERLKLAFQKSRDMDGALGVRLEAYATATRDIFPAYSQAIDRLVKRIALNGGGENAPQPSDVMPDFILPDETGRLLALSQLLRDGPVIVMFFRGQWCPYCRLNVRAVVRAQDQIAALGGRIVAITPEVQEFTGLFKSESHASFPVLSDLDNGYALSLNLAIWLGAEIQQLIPHVDMPRFQGNEGWMLPIPATFVVRADGVIQTRFVDPDFRRRMEIDDLIAALKIAGQTM